jgi:transketolase
MNKNYHIKQILRAAYLSKEGHIPSSLSVLEIIWCLYNKVMHFDSSSMILNKSDRFILSKGHASLALYSVLVEKKIVEENEFNNFCKYNSLLGGHPDSNKIKGVEVSSGSLGHGLPIAIGMCLGFRIQNINNRVFCLVGDGECNEGTIWESILLAEHHNLSNLCMIIDNNNSTNRALSLNNVEMKFKGFNWNYLSVDGHDINSLYDALTYETNKPLVVIANTIKGKGVKLMENNPAWHHKFPNDEEYKDLINSLI